MENNPREVPAPRDTRQWLIPLGVVTLLAIGLFLVLGALAGSSGHGGYGWMMGGDGGWGWMWGAGALMMMVPLIFLIVLVLVLVPTGHTQVTAPAPPPPEDLATVLRVRYARGELTSEQYHRILNDLHSSG